MTIDDMMKAGQASFKTTLDHLSDELSKVRAGKASPSMLDGIMIDYYGNPTPLKSVANLGTADARTLTIQPWEKNMLAPIERAIFEANLGLTPMNDGEFIRINVPALTAERRQTLMKQCKGLGEDAKVGIRNQRQKMMEFLKKEVKNGYPEDEGKKREGLVENFVKENYKNIESLLEVKEKEIMKV
jgi:ribosome recycling factor